MHLNFINLKQGLETRKHRNMIFDIVKSPKQSIFFLIREGQDYSDL